MSKPLPFLKPIDSILSLTPEDQCLEIGSPSVQIPPRTLEEEQLLTCYVVKQSVYTGTHILDHLLTKPPGNSSHLSPLMLYRHALELGDAIGTLLRFGSATTGSILLAVFLKQVWDWNLFLRRRPFKRIVLLATRPSIRLNDFETLLAMTLEQRRVGLSLYFRCR